MLKVGKKESDKHLHPTQKPVELLEYLIKTYTNEGETVLDNCMGSGSTGVACINTNRNFIGIELDEGYFNIAKDRIEKASAAPVKPANNKSYFKKCDNNHTSIVDALASIGAYSSYSYRLRVASANGITGYVGTAQQNIKLLNLLKKGTLIKP